MITISCDNCSFNIGDDDSIITIESIEKLKAYCDYDKVERLYEDKKLVHYCSYECMTADNGDWPARGLDTTSCRCFVCSEMNYSTLPNDVIVIIKEFSCGCTDYAI